MNVNNETTMPSPLLLQDAILLYREASDEEHSDATLAMICPVQKNVIGAGRLLDRVTLDTLLRTMQGKKGEREILPTNVLWMDAGCMVWHVPAARRQIWFAAHNAKLRPLNGQTVAHPSLLFLAQAAGKGPGGLYVWALASDKRPASDTPVFRAPYFNIYQNGHMCSGNIRLPERVGPATQAEWEAGFFGTNFTHSNAGNLTRHKGGHDGLWEEMVDCKRFPARLLSPFSPLGKQKTVGEVIASEAA